jgi:transcription elongation factor GreA
MQQSKPIIFTKAGYEDLQKKYDTLLPERKTAIEQLQKAREMGDLSENGFYKAAKAKLSSIDHQMYRMKQLLRFGVVKESISQEEIEVGSKVRIDDGIQQREIMLVGDHEANPSEGKISFRSPIGKALFRRKTGEEIVVETPRGITKYKILQISI